MKHVNKTVYTTDADANYVFFTMSGRVNEKELFNYLPGDGESIQLTLSGKDFKALLYDSNASVDEYMVTTLLKAYGIAVKEKK